MAGEEDVAIDVMGRTYVIEFSIMQQVRDKREERIRGR